MRCGLTTASGAAMLPTARLLLTAGCTVQHLSGVAVSACSLLMVNVSVLKVACFLLTVRLPLDANAVQVSCDSVM